MDESRHLPGQPRRNLALFAAALGALTLTGLAVILCHSNLPVALSAGFTPKRSTAFRKPAVSYARQPLRFEENAGQTDGQVDFLARGLGYTVFLTRQGAVLSLAENQKSEIRNQKQETTDQRPRATDILRLNLVGAKRGAGARGLEELAGQSNYFIGNDPRKWRRNVRTFGKVEYSEVYPGVDLVYYGNQGKLEYDFVVARGADPSAITLDVGAGLVPAPVPSRTGPVRGRPRGSPLRIDGGGDL